MAYFPGDSAARFIGHRCAKHYLGDSYTEAERLFRIEAKCAEYLALWPQLQARLAAIEPLVRNLYAISIKLGELRTFIDRQSPGFARFMYSDLTALGGRIVTSKTAGAKSYVVDGLSFLSPDFNPAIVAARVTASCRDIRSPLPVWRITDGENEASKEIMRRGKAALARLKELVELRDKLDDAAGFLKAPNLRRLEQWKATGQSALSILSFKWEGQGIEALAESYAGRFQWSIVVPPDLMANLPTKEDVRSACSLEIMN